MDSRNLIMQKPRYLFLISLIAAAGVAGCQSGGSSDTTPTGPGPNGSYLFVSAENYYFGTTGVGTTRTQTIELVNRGGDIYPIKNLNVSGDNRDEFVSDFYGPITLNPAEAIRLNVTFQPVTDGRKFADIDIDFDTIRQVSDAANQNEQNFYAAADLEHQQDYRSASNKYNEYIQNGPVVDVNKRRAAVKLPVIKESETYGDGADFKSYLRAMNARDAGDYDVAMAEIDQLMLVDSDSYVADDSLYLKGYIQLMDQQDYAAAQETMERLRREFPNTTYYDTALYSEALALQSLGKEALATEVLLDLRYKHTGIEAFGLAMPKDNVLSRVWFDRASEALEQMGVL
jgi:TolA-binding protein